MKAPPVGIDVQVLGDDAAEKALEERVREIEQEALVQQARLALDRPVVKEEPHGIRRLFHRR
jgi:hypothetical protein